MDTGVSEVLHKQRISQLVNFARAARSADDRFLRGHVADYLSLGRVDVLIAASEAEPEPLVELLGAALHDSVADEILRTVDRLIDTQHTTLGRVGLIALDELISRGADAEQAKPGVELQYRRAERLMFLGLPEKALESLERIEKSGHAPSESLLLRAAVIGNLIVLRARQQDDPQHILQVEQLLPDLENLFEQDPVDTSETLAGSLLGFMNMLLKEERYDEVMERSAQARSVIGQMEDIGRVQEFSAMCAEAVIEVMLAKGMKREAKRALNELRENLIELSQDYPHRFAERVVMMLLNVASSFDERYRLIRDTKRALNDALSVMKLLPDGWFSVSVDGFLLKYKATRLAITLARKEEKLEEAIRMSLESEREIRRSIWRRNRLVARQRVAVLSDFTLALFATGQLRRAVRVVSLAEVLYRLYDFADANARYSMFVMLANAAAAREALGDALGARAKLEQLQQSGLDAEAIGVLEMANVRRTYGLLLRLQFEAGDVGAAFWTMCDIGSIVASRESMPLHERNSAFYKDACERFIALARNKSLPELQDAFRDALDYKSHPKV